MVSTLSPSMTDDFCLAAIMMEDSQTGQRYLQVKHFISRGVPASIITFLVIITLGYGLLRVAGL